jgi:hypothetical protein
MERLEFFLAGGDGMVVILVITPPQLQNFFKANAS